MTKEKEPGTSLPDGCCSKVFRDLLRPRIRIVNYDSRGPDVESSPVASVEIMIKGWGTPRQECSRFIAFEKVGSNLEDPNSWKYHHAEGLDLAQEENDKYEFEPISREEIEEFLDKYSSSLKEIKEEYCRMLGKRKKRFFYF
ncbi:MAG TPA: hypothetical protein VMW25_02870 [Clostridia bacterium]|nr:hypothetical protein [Clostridia bacterium]